MIRKFFLIIGMLLISFFSFTEVTFARSGVSSLPGEDYLVQPILVIPDDWKSKVTQDKEDAYKNGIRNILTAVQSDYRNILQGPTFNFSEVETKRIGPLNTQNAAHMCDILSKNGLDSVPPANSIPLNFIVGSGKTIDCALGNIAGISHDILENSLHPDNSKDYLWVRKTIAHELGHTFGLSWDGLANAHTCTILTPKQCKETAPEILRGEYPPSTECVSFMSYCQNDSYPMALDNTTANPEIKDLLQSSFITPKFLPPEPKPMPLVKKSNVYSISPSTIKLGSGVQLKIEGSGFGKYDKDLYHIVLLSKSGLSTDGIFWKEEKWTDSKIIVSLEATGKVVPYDTRWQVLIKTQNGEVMPDTDLLLIPPAPASTPKPTETLGVFSISGISSDTVKLNRSFNILGSGFGAQPGGISFVDSSGFSQINRSQYNWSDTNISVIITEALYKTRTQLKLTLTKSTGEKIDSQVIFEPDEISQSSTLTPTPTVQPTESPTLQPTSPSPSSSPPVESLTQNCNLRGGVCFGTTCLVDNDPSGECDPATPLPSASSSPTSTPTSIITPTSTPTSSQNPTPSPSQIPTPTPAPVKKVTKISVINGLQVFDITSNPTQIVDLDLSKSEAVNGIYQVRVQIDYSDGSSKFIPFNFIYQPNANTPTPSPSLSQSEVYCNQIGGACQDSCSGTQTQRGTCEGSTKGNLCCVENTVATPQGNASKCPGDDITRTGVESWGTSCKPGDPDKVLSANNNTACTIASCFLYTKINEYCWYNSGKSYPDYNGCFRKGHGVQITTPPPTPYSAGYQYSSGSTLVTPTPSSSPTSCDTTQLSGSGWSWSYNCDCTTADGQAGHHAICSVNPSQAPECFAGTTFNVSGVTFVNCVRSNLQ